MSFHKRYISNEQIIRLFNSSGATGVFNWYTKGVDLIITEAGIASKLSSIISKSNLYSKLKIEGLIADKIYKEQNKQELKNRA